MSKLTQLFACFSLMGSSMLAQSSPDLKLPYWQDVQTTSVNKEAPRTSFMTYADRTQAMSGQFEKSPYYQLLNGTWKFFYVDAYKDLPADITSPTASTEGWHDIQVPGLSLIHI